MCTVVTSTMRIVAALLAVSGLVLWISPQHAAAQPPRFPNLAGFVPASIDSYFQIPDGSGGYVEVPAKGPRFAYFSTPYNVQCYFEAGTEPIQAWSGQDVNCIGDLPGMDKVPYVPDPSIPDSCVTGSAGPGENGWGPGFALSRKTDECDIKFSRGALLDVGQKLSYRNVTCAVGEAKLIACLDTTRGEHGFVLQPSGSWAF